MATDLKKLLSDFTTLPCEFKTDEVDRLLYSTDASAYREVPYAVAFPKNKEEVRKLIVFAAKHKIPLIPRTAGTSLAGQVVGKGIIVDISRYMRNILEFNKEEKWVKVEPGVVLDELNLFLKPHGLFFSPETSTSNRCMIGGMAGNNSCGSHSLIYGSTREHVLEITAYLSDGSEAVFSELTIEEFQAKCKLNNLEGTIYRKIFEILSDKNNQQEIRDQYPRREIQRRNTGYALDLLLESNVFTEGGENFNLCKLLCGSEGTLCFFTELKLNLVPLPPPEQAVMCVHLNSVDEALQANIVALKHKPDAIELIDKVIIDLTKENIEQRKNRGFIEGEPGAILIVEAAKEKRSEIDELFSIIEHDLRKHGLGYHFPVLYGKEINKVWALRKAGLGLLSNMPGDRKPVPVIEDTSVRPEDLPEYIREFKEILAKYNLDCVYYAHIATGELHLRPVLNLKDPKDVELFRIIALEIAHLVKKYKGSLSGEHGDGRLRGEFIPIMLGDKVYTLLKEVKTVFDPYGIFNPNKIVDTPPMNTSLRYVPGQLTNEPAKTFFDYSGAGGFIRMAEKCNGSADCRRTHVFGGLMCPSYHATLEEDCTTRARANLIREYFTNPKSTNPFDSEEIKQILDLCLSCKGCKSECPSNVDIAKMKAEFLQHYYDVHGVPMRSKLVANINSLNRIASVFAGLYNFAVQNKSVSRLIKKSVGFAEQRSLPLVAGMSFRKWCRINLQTLNPKEYKKSVYLFVDEFTNYNDVAVGISCVLLLTSLGYRIKIVRHSESGRASISKGLIRKATKYCNENVRIFSEIVSENEPLLGIEPSTLLSFRDEYPELCCAELKNAARELARHCFMIDEFLYAEYERGAIDRSMFTTEKRKIILHGHCHQKALASIEPTRKLLEIPENYTVEVLKTSCCGMAGSFGYEKEHYELSQKVGELVLFPAVRNAERDTIVVAPGTSCRHQIKDGTGTDALHPAQVLWNALNKETEL